MSSTTSVTTSSGSAPAVFAPAAAGQQVDQLVAMINTAFAPRAAEHYEQTLRTLRDKKQTLINRAAALKADNTQAAKNSVNLDNSIADIQSLIAEQKKILEDRAAQPCHCNYGYGYDL